MRIQGFDCDHVLEGAREICLGVCAACFANLKRSLGGKSDLSHPRILAPSDRTAASRAAARAYKDATQPERKHEWHLAAPLVAEVLLIIGLSAALSFFGRFESSVAFVMGTALGAFAAILKHFLLPIVDSGSATIGGRRAAVKTEERALKVIIDAMGQKP